jgi:hypothetical protein
VGWIDSKRGYVDERHTALLCTPRKSGSGSSKVNKDRLVPLLGAGLFTPQGTFRAPLVTGFGAAHGWIQGIAKVLVIGQV